MMTLDMLCGLPRAGLALLVAHRWLAERPATGATAFDLMRAAIDSAKNLEDLHLVLDRIVANDELAHCMLDMLNVLLAFDRTVSLAKSLGVELEFSEQLLAELHRLRDEARKKGGAS